MADFTRGDTNTEIRPESRNAINGIAYGDSTVFLAHVVGGTPQTRIWVRKWKGDTFLTNEVTQPTLNSALRRLYPDAHSVSFNVTDLAFLGNSQLAIIDTYLLNPAIIVLNSSTNAYVRGVRLPNTLRDQLAIKDATDSGGPYPLLLSKIASSSTDKYSIRELINGNWTDRFSSTTLENDIGDSSSTISGIASGDTTDELYVVTNSHIYYYYQNNLISKSALATTGTITGVAWNKDKHGLYFSISPASGNDYVIFIQKYPFSFITGPPTFGFQLTLGITSFSLSISTGNPTFSWQSPEAHGLELEIRTGDLDFEFDAIAETPALGFTKLNRGPPASIGSARTGIAFDYDSDTYYFVTANRTSIAKFSGDTYLPSFTATQLAALKTTSTTVNFIVGAIAYMGDSTLAIYDDITHRIYFANTVTHLGDTSKIVRVPGFTGVKQVLDMTGGGDSTPWLLTVDTSGVGPIESRRILNRRIYQYTVGDSTTTRTETRPTGPPVTITQYRTTGDSVNSQTTYFNCSSLIGAAGYNADLTTYSVSELDNFFRRRRSIARFREERSRYRTGAWQNTREAALTAGRFTEVVTSANIQLAIDSVTQVAAPTTLSSNINGCILKVDRSSGPFSGGRYIWNIWYIPIPELTSYVPKVETRQQTVQGDTTVTITETVKTNTWSIKVDNSDLTPFIGSALPYGLSKGTADNDIYITNNNSIYYFLNRTFQSQYNFETGDTDRTWGTAWNSKQNELYVLKNRILSFKRSAPGLSFSIDAGPVRVGFIASIEETITTTVWDRGDSTNDIDVSSYPNVTGLAHDGTSLYFGDKNNNLILKVNPTTKAISAFVDFGDTLPGIEYPSIDALAYGDSKIWVGDASNKKIYSYDLDGRNPSVIDVPDFITPVGLAHTGDTDTIPYVLDSTNKKVISYKERKNIIEPEYGDSHVDFTFYEPRERETEVTRYRITGDTEIDPTYTSIGIHNLEANATRYYAGDTDYATLEEAIEAAKYQFAYKQDTERRYGSEKYKGDTTECVPIPKKTEYRVIGEIDRGKRSVSVTCADVVRGQTYFQKTYQRYRNTGWFSSRNDAIRASLYNGTQRFNPDSTGFGAYINGRLVAQNASCNTGIFHSRIAHRSYYVHINPPRNPTIPHRLPRVITRQTGGGDSCTTREVEKTRTTTSTVKEIRRWEPTWEPVGDTLVETVQRKITRQIDVRPLISPGDSSTTITGWGDQITTETLRDLSPGIIPTGLTIGPSKNLFVLDANEDKAWFLYQGEERFPDTEDQDLTTNVLREPNSQIEPAAIAWDRGRNRTSGFYISDTQARKIYWFEYSPVLEMKFRTGPTYFGFEAEIAGVKFNTGEAEYDFVVERRIYPTWSYTTGNPEYNFAGEGDTNPLAWKISTGSPTVSMAGRAAETTNFSFDFTTGDVDIDFVANARQQIFITYSTGEPEFDFEATRRIFVGWNYRTQDPTIGFDLDAIESIPIEFTTGDPVYNFDVTLRESVFFPMEFRTGTTEYEFDAFASQVISPQIELTTGDPEVEFDVRNIITYPAYIEFTINTAPSSPLVEFQMQTETTIVPNLLEAETDPIDIMSDIPSIDGPQLKKYKTKAYAHYELTTARSLTPRARRGDTFSDIRYPFPHVTREPTPIDQSTPQLTVPMPTIRHQNRQVILHWSEQQGLLPTRSQLQVSENENGPWFAPDLTDNNEFRTGDSGGFATTEGFEEVIPNIPLKGTADIPEPRTLCYRVRRIDNDGDVSEWSPPVAVTLNPLQTQEYGPQSITASKFVQHLFGSQGVGDKIAYWSMDDTAGSEGETHTPTELGFLQDTSEEGTPYPLRVSGRQITSVTGIVSRAIFLDGWNNYSYAASGRIGMAGDSFPSMSMMAFVKGGNFQPQDPIGLLSYYVDDNDYINISYARRARILRVRVGDSFIVNSDPLTLFNGTWRQIGFTYDATTKNLQLFLDGVLLKEQIIGDTKDFIPQNGVVGVGGLVGLNSVGTPFLSFKMRGAIDEVRVWKRVLSSDEFSFFRNFPKGAGNSQFITPDRILEGSISADKLAANAIDVLFANIHGRALFGTPVDVENTAQGFRTHIDSDEIRIQRIKDSQWVDHGRIWQTQEGAYAIFNGDLSETDFFGDTTQFLANVAIEPNRIVVTRGTGRAVQTPRKISMQQLVGDTWVERARFTRNHLAFYDTSGNELTTIGQNFNVGDSLGFDGGYVITKKPNQNVLDFSGSINAISIPQSTLSGTINQDDFYFIIDPLIETSAKVSGYGYLKENSGGNTPFKGPIHAISKTGTNLSIQGFNVDTNESQTLTVGSTITAKLFDSYSLAV